jgi:hypothetical protein
MKIKVQDLKPGMLLVYTSGKGILTVANVVPMIIESYPQQYQVKFEGISQPVQVGEDTEFEVIAL